MKNSTLTEVIVLAGGLGTRLRSVVKDIPKPMADISGRPFLEYVFNYLQPQGVTRIILAVGYRYELIEQHFGTHYKGMEIVYAVENTPLGTGGAIRLALRHATTKNVGVLNGDTLFTTDLQKLYTFHCEKKASLSLAVCEMHDFDRYGTIELEGHYIKAFREKKAVEKGYINAGVYIIEQKLLEQAHLAEKFSFEKEILEKYYQTNPEKMLAYLVSPSPYFIDIGIPTDYEKAQTELPALSFA
jgi:D-glycero-alpha-D-manno-heptose 1-phosphate guanylyltransferase